MGMRIYTIGLGPNDTTTQPDDPEVVDFAALETYAKIGGGQSFRARTGEDLDAAAHAIEALMGGKILAPPTVIHDDLWSYPGALFTLAAAGMVAAPAVPSMIVYGTFALLRPWWLIALPVFCLLVALTKPRGGVLVGWPRVVDPALLTAMGGARRRQRRRRRLAGDGSGRHHRDHRLEWSRCAGTRYEPPCAISTRS